MRACLRVHLRGGLGTVFGRIPPPTELWLLETDTRLADSHSDNVYDSRRVCAFGMAFGVCGRFWLLAFGFGVWPVGLGSH